MTPTSPVTLSRYQHLRDVAALAQQTGRKSIGMSPKSLLLLLDEIDELAASRAVTETPEGLDVERLRVITGPDIVAAIKAIQPGYEPDTNVRWAEVAARLATGIVVHECYDPECPHEHTGTRHSVTFPAALTAHKEEHGG